jgi:hypothetical protein
LRRGRGHGVARHHFRPPPRGLHRTQPIEIKKEKRKAAADREVSGLPSLWEEMQLLRLTARRAEDG